MLIKNKTDNSSIYMRTSQPPLQTPHHPLHHSSSRVPFCYVGHPCLPQSQDFNSNRVQPSNCSIPTNTLDACPRTTPLMRNSPPIQTGISSLDPLNYVCTRGPLLGHFHIDFILTATSPPQMLPCADYACKTHSLTG